MAVWRIILLFLFGATCATSARVDAQPLQPRFALVVGIGDYAHLDKLANPVRDAQAVAAALRREKFTVTFVPNATRAELKRAATAYREQVAKAGNAVSIVFYSGHGVQVDGQNTLLMKDAALSGANLAATSYALSELMFDVAPKGSNKTIFVFDACRSVSSNLDGRLAAGFAESGRNDAPPGSLVSYSTAAGAIASDGLPLAGSPFAKALLEEIPVPAQRVEVMFTKVRKRVLETTDNVQQPAVYGMWDSDVVLSLQVASEDAKLTAEAEAKRYAPAAIRDLEGGYKLALRAANHNYAPAMNVVASALYYGDGVRKDQKAALRWYERAAELGDNDALFTLASISPDRKHAIQAVPVMRRLAAEGDARAAYLLALMHQEGTNVPVDKAEALRLYKIAADQGWGAAMINYGRLHQLGQGTSINLAVAKDMYSKAAQLGSPRAKSLLAHLLTTAGTGVRDAAREREALQMLQKAFADDAWAGVNLGWHHYFGLGTKRDRDEAVRTWEKARNHPLPQAEIDGELKRILDRVRRGGAWRECGAPQQPRFCPS